MTMAESMTDERLAEIEYAVESDWFAHNYDDGRAASELLAEIKRLRDVQATLVDGGTYTASQLNRIARIVQHADLLHGHVVEAASGEEPPTLDSVIQAITQILVEDEPVKNAWIIVWRELIGGMTLCSEQQLRKMAEQDRDETWAEIERLRAQMARLDDCLTAMAAEKGSNRYAGRGQLVTLLRVDDVREMIGEWREAGADDA